MYPGLSVGGEDMMVRTQTRSLASLVGGRHKLVDKNRSDRKEHDTGSCDKGQG